MSTILEPESSSGALSEDVSAQLMKAHSGLAAAVARVLTGEHQTAASTAVSSSVLSILPAIKIIILSYNRMTR